MAGQRVSLTWAMGSLKLSIFTMSELFSAPHMKMASPNAAFMLPSFPFFSEAAHSPT